AEVRVRGRFVNQRLAGVPIETNVVIAEPDGEGGLRMWVSSQVPFRVRDEVAEAVGLPEAKVRVVTPDVGGGFGAKLATYPEHSVVGALAMKLGRPVRWLEYRTESMVAMTHGRAQLQKVSLGAMRDGTLVGLEVELIGDAGAYPAIGAYLPLLTGQMSCGVYDLPKAWVRARASSTNTSVVAAYRGAGRPEATALIERAMDMLADELGIDPADLRRRNLITPPFPHDTPTGVTYDSGDYVRALDGVIESDTGVVKSGDGSYFSRSLQLGGSAVRGACVSLIEKAREEAARRLEANVEDIVRIEGGRFGVRGVPSSSLGWADLAANAV